MLDRLTEDQRKVLMMWFFLLIFLIGLVVLIANNKIKKRVADEKDKTYVVVRDEVFITISRTSPSILLNVQK